MSKQEFVASVIERADQTKQGLCHLRGEDYKPMSTDHRAILEALAEAIFDLHQK